MITSSTSFDLPESAEVLADDLGITIYLDDDGIERAAFWIDGSGDPLSPCDPEQFGYAEVLRTGTDVSAGVGMAEVVDVLAVAVSL